MYSLLNNFFDNSDALNNLNPQKESTKQKKRKTIVHDKSSKLYNDFLQLIIINAINYHMIREKTYKARIQPQRFISLWM